MNPIWVIVENILLFMLIQSLQHMLKCYDFAVHI